MTENVDSSQRRKLNCRMHLHALFLKKERDIGYVSNELRVVCMGLQVNIKVLII